MGPLAVGRLRSTGLEKGAFLFSRQLFPLSILWPQERDVCGLCPQGTEEGTL